MRQLFRVSFILFYFATMASVSLGGNIEDAIAVYESGDQEKGLQLILIEAEHGDLTAQIILGMLNCGGSGVAKNCREGVKWFTMAAEQGNVDAQDMLAGLYKSGRGTVQSDEDAYAWWIVAAASGHEGAQRNRDSTRRRLTPTQIEKGQQIAKEIWARLGN